VYAPGVHLFHGRILGGFHRHGAAPARSADVGVCEWLRWDQVSVTVEIEGESIEIPHFNPRPLKNLLLIDQLESLSPITDMRVTDLAGEETPQLYALCGRGPRSTLRTLRHGLAVAEMAVSELPSNPLAVWTVKSSIKEQADKYIVVTFTNATIVLSIGETVEEVTDSGFLATDRTLSVSLLGDDMLLQIHPAGLRTVRADKRISQFTPPGKGIIHKCAVNSNQVTFALAHRSTIFFELDALALAHTHLPSLCSCCCLLLLLPTLAVACSCCCLLLLLPNLAVAYSCCCLLLLLRLLRTLPGGHRPHG